MRNAPKALNIFAYQKGNYLTASVPVPRLHVYVRRLVERGHKVGVIRQTETAALKAGGETDAGKGGLFERKLVGLYTKSTLEAGVAVDASGGTNDKGESVTAADGRFSSYLLCIAEEPVSSSSSSDEGGGRARIGVAAVDASTGDVLHDEFVDSSLRAELEARLLRVAPAEILLVEPLSTATTKLVKTMYGDDPRGGGARVEAVARGSGYGDGGAAAAVAASIAEFGRDGDGDRDRGATASTSGGSGAAASGAAVAAIDLPSQTLRAVAVAFDWLRQFGLCGVLALTPAFRPMRARREMNLSPNVMRQLELLRSIDGAHRGSLLWLMGSNARTPCGSRLVRRWVSHPLTDKRDVERRLDAVDELRTKAEDGGGHGGVLSDLAASLKAAHGGGDCERYLARVFHGTATPAELVAGLSAVRDFARLVRNAKAKEAAGRGGEIDAAAADDDDECASLASSALLREYLDAASDASVVHTCDRLLSMVDVENATNGKATAATALLPNATRFPRLESTRADIADAEKALEDLLPTLRQKLIDAGKKEKGGGGGGLALVPRLAYVTVALVEYLIELPDTLRGVPANWARMSTNKSKKVVRYHPPEVVAAAAALERARERHVAESKAAWASFLRDDAAGNFLELRAAVAAAAGLDALLSFAALARGNAGYVRPTFLPDDAPPALRVDRGRHPILDAMMPPGKTYVPNSASLAEDGVRALVITGPNMGGKSCFIRQTALIVVMAQCGSFVPAASAEMTVMDGVHTRMGASDNMAMGASTFLEEMSECSSILAAASKKSLVVLDELGRGTATTDGTAIAHATLEHLVSNAKCLTLLVTHYPSVAKEITAKYPKHCAAAFTSYVRVRRNGRVAARNKNENVDDVEGGPGAGAAAAAEEEEEEEEGEEGDRIEFLYSLTTGVAHRSFGLNVARMAGVPENIIRLAGRKAKELEEATTRRRSSGMALTNHEDEDVTRAKFKTVVDAMRAAEAAEDPEKGVAIIAGAQAALRGWGG